MTVEQLNNKPGNIGVFKRIQNAKIQMHQSVLDSLTLYNKERHFSKVMLWTGAQYLLMMIQFSVNYMLLYKYTRDLHIGQTIMHT